MLYTYIGMCTPNPSPQSASSGLFFVRYKLSIASLLFRICSVAIVHSCAANTAKQVSTEPALGTPHRQTLALTHKETAWSRGSSTSSTRSLTTCRRCCSPRLWGVPRLNRTYGHGRSSARCPYRIQPAKARSTVNRVRRRRPRTETVMPVGIPARFTRSAEKRVSASAAGQRLPKPSPTSKDSPP